MKTRGTPVPTGLPDITAPDAEASAWLVHFASGRHDPAKEQAFAAWLDASPDHRAAFRRASQLWDGIAEIDGIEHMLAGQDAVSIPRQQRTPSRRGLLIGGLAASLACAAGTGLLLLGPSASDPVSFSTARGEIRTFTLTDGSKITLGGASRVEGLFSDAARDLRLVNGNAYFDIARDERRPLSVDAGRVRVRVLGTRFDIRKRTGQVSVAVEHGHVRVTADAAARDLRAGERIVSDAALPLGEVGTFDADRVFSWRTGRLSFVDAPLRDIVADMNQYSDLPVRLAPGAPAEMRLTLSFPVGQIGQVLAGLDAAYPLDVRESDTEIVIFASR